MANEISFRTMYQQEKPFGVGATAHERHQRIVGGWVAEAIDGLDEGEAVYTGVEPTEADAILALSDRLTDRGYSRPKLVRIR